MKKIYKLVSCILTAAFLCSFMAGAAFAQENKTIELPYAGLKFTVPDEYSDLMGIVEMSGGEMEPDSGVYCAAFIYTGMTPEDYEELKAAEDPTAEQLYDYITSVGCIAYVYAVNDGRGAKDLIDYLEEDGIEIEAELLTRIGEAQDCTFYIWQDIPESSYMKEGFAQEFQMLQEHPEYITDNLEFSVPKDTGVFGTDGELHFETTDVFGNKITSEELFGDRKVTMLNVWTTWCIYCLQEMEELEEISRKAKEKDCAVVGILADGITPEAVEKGISIMEEYGVTYTVILPWDGFNNDMPLQGYPTTLFIDSEGRVLGDAVTGAYVDQYESRIDEELAAMEK